MALLMTSPVSSVDWSQYGPMLTCADLATIYTAYTIGGIRKMVQRRSSKMPTPCSVRPFVFRKADVIRHFERLSA
jgi:hypothetical protein